MKKKIIVIHTSPLRLKNKSVVNRLPLKQNVIKNFFFDSDMSAIAPRIGAVINTNRAAVPARKAHSVVAFVDNSMPQNLKIHPSEGTITVAKYIGRRAAITVVANAEFAQSYIYHANTSFFLSLFIGVFYRQLESIITTLRLAVGRVLYKSKLLFSLYNPDTK